MATTPPRPTRVNPAVKYREFLSKMYEQFRHDDGRDVDEWNEVGVPAAFDFIRFRTEEELKVLDPSKPEFWKRKFHDDCGPMGRGHSANPRLPPDPLSDGSFNRIQKRVCNKPSHFSLLEQSIQRCELPDEELEKGAEDIPTIDDSEDLNKEIESLCRAFEKHLEGDVDVSEEDEDIDEHEAEQLRENTRNILEDLNGSEAADETILEATEVRELCEFRPRKSSTFLIPQLEVSQSHAMESSVEDPDTIIEVAETADLEPCDELEEDSSSFLRIRVTCEETDSSTSQETESSVSTLDTEITRLVVPKQRTRRASESNNTPKKQHPPLHLLTPLQRRLVKLDLY